MQKIISGIELRFITIELQRIIHSKIEQIYQPNENEILIQLHITGIGKKFLRIMVPYVVYLSDIKGENPERPSGFCTYLRKHLLNARISEIKQIGCERVLEIKIETKDSYYYIVIELFSKGNVILCNSNKMIMSCLFNQIFKEREIKSNKEYVLPSSGINVFETGFEDFIQRILSSKRDSLVKALAIELSVGGIFSEEICLRAKIDKNKNPNLCKREEIEALYNELKELINSKINAVGYISNGVIIDVFPFPLLRFRDYEKEEFSSFNEAIDKKMSEKILSKSKAKKTELYEREIAKLKNAIELQKNKIVEFEKREKEAKDIAELIYSKYQLINEIMSEINNAKEKYSLGEIAKRLKRHKIVKEVNPKDKCIVIEIED